LERFYLFERERMSEIESMSRGRGRGRRRSRPPAEQGAQRREGRLHPRTQRS